MVGIPRSKGCTTCRRRKIKCDLGRPLCENCAKSGRRCEGYEQYPIFLITTMDGPKLRTHLEEAKEPSQPLLMRDTLVAGGAYRENRHMATADLTQTLSARSIWERQVVSWFWESYAPSTRLAGDSNSGSIWLYHAIQVADPVPVLEQALLALSMTRYGRVKGNLDLIKRGQRTYGIALNLLQKALYDDALMKNDETLASVRALVLYELFESTSTNASAWHQHLAGITTLMASRGPEMHCSPMARTVLEDIRYALMLKALMLHKSSIFGHEDWLHIPWRDRPKSTEQQLYDHGFQLAAILERADSLEDPSLEARNILVLCTDLLEACHRLQQQLETLFTNAFKSFLQERSSAWRSSVDQIPDPSTLNSADIGQLLIVLNLWGCQLLLGFAAKALRARINATINLHPGLTADRPAMNALCGNFASYSDQDALSDIAHALLRYLPLCFGNETNEFAPSRTIFPVTCILWQFRYSKPEFRQTMTLMRSIIKARDVRFAQLGHSVIGWLPYIARDEGDALVDRQTPDTIDDVVDHQASDAAGCLPIEQLLLQGRRSAERFSHLCFSIPVKVEGTSPAVKEVCLTATSTG